MMLDDTTLRILACQIDVPCITNSAERDAHLRTSAVKVRTELAKTEVDLVALPELSSIDYARETFANLADIAEPLDGPSFECWRQVAMEFGVYVSFGFARQEGEKYYISNAVIAPSGDLVGHFDKLHLAQFGASMEKEYFRGGDHVFVYDIKGFTIAPIICYDIRIPELTRTLVIDHQADLILHSGAYYRDESFHTWHSFTTTRALENQVFFLSLNRAGDKYGNSVMSWPWMDENRRPVSFEKHAEDFRVLTLVKSELTAARENYSFLADRFGDYGALPKLPSS